MPDVITGALSDHLATLFGAGTCAGLTDGELLERFRTSRDEGGERAFEALVTRRGPMVLGICRNFLDDPNDVQDAFQAVFLVLARRAGAIRKSESVGSWLYGVTVRVAARARATAVRRRDRERRVLAAASTVALAGGSPEAGPGDSAEHDDGAAVVHQEVAGLPERYRTPIVLCYFEGLTHDEAAARLSWPVGTVRSRLARARDRLRTRLIRRGVTTPSTIGPLAAWLIAGHAPATASAAIRATAAVAPLPVHVPASLARAAVKVAAGQPAAAGSWSAASMALADGVLKTMTLKKLTLAGCVIASLGLGTGTGALLIRGVRAQNPAAPAGAAPDQPAAKAAPAPPKAIPSPPKDENEHKRLIENYPIPPGIDPQLKQVITAAIQRLDAQRAYYEEGRLTLDRFLTASESLERVELLAAKGFAERRAVRKRHVDRLREIVNREQAELQVGRGTVADVAEADLALKEAEYTMRVGDTEDAEKATLLRRIDELERNVEKLRKQLDPGFPEGPGRTVAPRRPAP
jgi:RNA polymerase sigma factor (sigma-70 family)